MSLSVSLNLRIPCSHIWHTLLLCSHQGHPSALCICTLYQTDYLLSECTKGSRGARNLASSIWQWGLHRTTSPARNSRRARVKSLSSDRTVRRCTDSFDGAFWRLARGLLACAFPHMAHSLYLASFVTARARWARFGPNLLASSFLIWSCFLPLAYLWKF